MLSDHLRRGVESARVAWSQLPASEDLDGEDEGPSVRISGSGVESLDYEVIENFAYREEQAHRGKLYVGYYVMLKWILSLLVGVGTGLAAVFINLAVENFSGWKFAITFSIIKRSYLAGFLVYILFNLSLVLSSVYIITEFAPAAAGSGIPEIKGYLNGVDAHGILLFRTLVGKIFGSIGSVGGGLALGKEGPLVHTGACIASLLGQGGSTKYHLSSRLLPIFQSDRDRRDLVTCGCAAGVAAAFRAPVGGVLFALEEVTSWWRSQLMWRVFFTSAVVAVVVRSAMGWCKNGNCGHFGSGGFIIWDISGGQEDYSFQELFPVAIIGIIGGLLGALFNQLTLYLTSWRRNYLHKKGNRVKVIEVCLISLMTSVLSFSLPLLRKCSPCPNSGDNSNIECPNAPGIEGNYVEFYCSNGKEYNDLATIFFNTQDDAIRNLFSAKTFHEYSAQSLLTFLAVFYSLAVVTFGTAVPAGQFIPGITIGSTYGRLVGMLVVKVYKKLNVEEGTYALLGAASFLGGSMRMTVSLCVIMVEITNNLKLLPLIMLVLLISKAVGDVFNDGLYEVQARVRGIPLLESRPKQYMRHVTAKEACRNQNVISFNRIVRVSDVISVLRAHKHNGFPVVDHRRNGETLVIGIILRSHLLVLLQSKADFQNSPFPSNLKTGTVSIRHKFSDFVKPVSSKGLSIDDIHLTEDDMSMYIDLAPFVNPSPYVVPEDMSLAKVYNLFRQLGLRHIFVIPRAPHVIGLITRKDLLSEETADSAEMDRRKKTTTLRSVLAVVAPLLLLAAHGVHARRLSAVPSNYVPGGVLRTWGQGSSFSGSEASGCEETYGFLPCTNTALGNLFLLLVYGYLMFLAATYMSNGSEMLLEILGPGIIGGLFLPALGALPDAILILVSGLSGSKDTAQQQVLIGMGLLAGSTVMLLTVLWGSCVVLGKCDLSENLIAIDGQDTKKFSLSGSGITTDIQTNYSARIMIISILPFIIVQLPKIFKWSTGHRLTILIALFVSVGLLISYCVYQVFQPWIQQRRLAYAKQKHIISGILRDLQQRALGRLLEDDGSPNEDVIRKMFHRVDDDQNGSLSRAELKALILGIQFDAADLNFDEAIDKIMKDFDTSNDEMIDESEFVRGMCKWLDEAKCSLSNTRNFSTKFFHEFHARTREEHRLLQDTNEEEGSESVKNPHWITLKAVSLLLLGAGIAVLFADPLVDAVDNFSDATGIPSFFISFIAMPLATNSSEGVSAVIFAIRKKQKTASLTFSEIYGAVTMNNTLCLSVFLALVYVRELTWDFSSEVLIIIVVCIVMGFVASFRSMYPLWTSFVAFLLYPVSLILVYVLDFIFGWS